MTSKTGIVLVGLNGSGKSTLAKYAAQKFGFDLLEVEDYWFEKQYDYQNPRNALDASQLMMNAIAQSTKGFIIGGNISSFSKALESHLSLIVYVDVEKEIRIQRVIQRDKERYGSLEKGTSLYHTRQDFLTFVQLRTADTIISWMESTNIPLLTIDGTDTLEKNTKMIQQRVLSL